MSRQLVYESREMVAMPCPTKDELSAYHTGRLNEANETAIFSHVGTCPACESYLDQLDQSAPTDPVLASLCRSVSNPVPTIPGYIIRSLIGQGGMGRVYRATQLGLNREVALKLLSSAHDGPELQQRFRREAGHLASLRHPHVVTVYDVGDYQGGLYFSMELCPGGTLADWQAQRPIPPRQAAELILQLAEGVSAAHHAGIIHRDLKPANILLENADAVSLKISDFGIARKIDGPTLTQSGVVAGTPTYMAPEQIGGRDIGPTADIHALGAILFELLTGRPPFLGSDMADTLNQVKHHEPISPNRIQPAVPRDLAVITLNCLQKDPRSRYTSASALADDLNRFLRNEPIHARPTSLLVRGQKWSRRHPGAATAIAIAILAIVMGISGALYYTRKLGDSLNATRHAEQIATQNAQAALDALDSMVHEVKTHFYAEKGGLAVRNKILESALIGLKKVVAAHDPSAPKISEVSAWTQISRLQWSLGQTQQSIVSSSEARNIAALVLATDPKNEGIRYQLADATWHLGTQQIHASMPDKARETYADYVKVTEAWIADNPNSDKARRQLIRAYESKGHAHQWVHQFDVAQSWFEKMIDSADKWAAAQPDNAMAIQMQARSNLLRGTLASDQKDLQAAKTHFSKGLELYERVAIKDPDNQDVTLGVQTCHYELAMSGKALGDLKLAEFHGEKATSLARDRHQKNPDSMEFQLQYVDVLFECADIDRQAGRPKEALEKLHECRDRLAALDQAGKLKNRPVYGIERRKQVDDAIANWDKSTPPKR